MTTRNEVINNEFDPAKRPICPTCKTWHVQIGSDECAMCRAKRYWKEWNIRREIWNRTGVLPPLIDPNAPDDPIIVDAH